MSWVQGINSFVRDGYSLGLIRETRAHDAAQTATLVMLTLTPSPDPLRLLLVETDMAVSSALQRRLRRAGWEVVAAENGAMALRIKPGFAPHAVLLSLDLPDMDGSVLATQLAIQGDCAIVAMSGRGEAARQETLAGGAHDYLPKPMSMQDILARLQGAVGRLSVEVAPGGCIA